MPWILWTITGFVSACVVLFLLILWAADGWQTARTLTEQSVSLIETPTKFETPVSDSNSPLRLLTWNISYGYGIGSSSGTHYIKKGPEEFKERLTKIADIISRNRVDIAMLQEVDYRSERSHDVDQLLYLAKKAEMPFAVRAPAWRARYVPFPYWPFRNHFGRIYSGGAILSRFPIMANTTHLHPKPLANPWWYNLFYLFYYSQSVTINFRNHPVVVINNHFDASDNKTRELQAKQLIQLTKEIQKTNPVTVIAGDFNAMPYYASKKANFPDDPPNDLRSDTTIEILKGLPNFQEVVTEREYLKNESSFFTFPSVGKNRQLDHVFVNQSFKVLHFETIQTGDISDHLPILFSILN